MLTSVGKNITLRGNAEGFRARPTAASCPNAITLINASVGSNRDYGGTITRGSTFKMVGGSVEGNGIGALEGYGLKFIDCGEQGAAGMDLDSVYFEHNKGLADVVIQHGAYNCAYAFRSCNFCRLHSSEYVQNNIRLIANATVNKCRVSVEGACAFYHPPTAGYLPDASRPYIDATGSVGDWTIEPALGTDFMSALETPTRQALNSRTDLREIAASAYFDATANGAVEIAPTLNGTIARAGTGTYVFNFTRKLTRANYRIGVTAEAPNFYCKILGQTQDYMIFELIQNGADADVEGVSVEIIGGAPYN